MRIADISIPNVEYTNGWCTGTKVNLLYRTSGGERRSVVLDPEWYFLVRRKDFHEGRQHFDLLRKQEWIHRWETHIDNKDFIRIYTDNENLSRYKINEGKKDGKSVCQNRLHVAQIPTYEMDLSSLQRLMIDLDIKIASRYKTVYLDIETKDSDDVGRRFPISKTLEGHVPILACGFEFADGTQRFIRAPDPSRVPIEEGEYTVLTTIAKVMRSCDIVATFNGSLQGGFDLPVIRKRMEVHDIRFSWQSIIDIDIRARMKKIHAFNSKVNSYSLENLSRIFLGEGKVEHSDQTIWQMFRYDPDKFREYTLRDVNLTRRLDQTEGVISFMTRQAQLCGSFLNKFYISNLIDAFILKEGKKEGEPLPSVKLGNVKPGKFRGAVVLQPIPGRYQNVNVLDFKSLYPSLIQTFNIGNDTIIKMDDESENGREVRQRITERMDAWKEMGLIKSPKPGVYFVSDTPSILARTVAKFNAERARCKREMKAFQETDHEWILLNLEQEIWKIMANSTYGITGAVHTRYFERDVAESITYGGQEIHGLTCSWYKANGHEIVYGDTDSLFDFDPQERVCDSELARFHAEFPSVLKEKFGCPKSFIVLENEKKFLRLVIVRKKFYGGTIMIGGELKFKAKGLDKREYVGLVRKVHPKLFEDIVRNDRPAEYYDAWITRLQEKILYGPIPKDKFIELVVHKQVSKPANAYVGGRKLDAHVRIFMDLVASGKDLQPGATIQMIRVMPDTEVEESEEEDDNDFMDYETFLSSGRELNRQEIWNTDIFSKLAPVLKAVYPDHDWDRFDSKKVKKRNRIADAFKKEMDSPKDRKIISLRNRLRNEKNLSKKQVEDLLRYMEGIDPDTIDALASKARAWASKRALSIIGLVALTDPCDACGVSGSLVRGIIKARVHTHEVTLCMHCSKEKKKIQKGA